MKDVFKFGASGSPAVPRKSTSEGGDLHEGVAKQIKQVNISQWLCFVVYTNKSALVDLLTLRE